MSDTPPPGEQQLIPPQQQTSILTFLSEQDGGKLVKETSAELRDLIEALETHFDKYRGKVSGSLALNIKLTMDPKIGAYTVECEYATRLPKVPGTATVMWLGPNGTLIPNNPKQMSMF